MLRTRTTRDGDDYQVVCHDHEWASGWHVTIPVGCPHCVHDERAHQRYLDACRELADEVSEMLRQHGIKSRALVDFAEGRLPQPESKVTDKPDGPIAAVIQTKGWTP